MYSNTSARIFRACRPLCVLAPAVLLLFPLPASAQFGRLLDRIQNSVENEVDRAANRVTGGVEDAITDTVSCALGNTQCVEDAQRNGQPVVIVDSNGQVINDASGNPATSMAAAQAATEEPGQGVWRNYDFIPGKRVMFASDWESARVGRIPRDIRFISGNIQIVELGGKKVLEATSESVFEIPLDEPLPESFSLEYEGKAARLNAGTFVYFEPFSEPGLRYQTYPNHYLQLRGGESGIQFQNGFVSSTPNTRAASEDGLAPVKFQYDQGYAILYLGSDRIAQMPNASVPRGNALEFRILASPDYPAYVSDIVVAYDIDDPYSTLMDSGEFTTRGILFDTGQSRLRPESTTALNQILEMLEDHDDLNIVIEGHTDSQGDDNSNQTLSEDRAMAVKRFLENQGISANRLSARGMGESQPVADNGTEAGRQQNRRVVLKVD